MPIRWKVVTEDRKSCLVIASLYCYYYKKGSVVKARKETIGIMTFLTLKEAQNFREVRSGKIIKVEGLGRGKRPKYKDLCHFMDVLSFYTRILSGKSGHKEVIINNEYAGPKGTICYKKVKVLT